VCVLHTPKTQKYTKRYINTVTRPFLQNLNKIHKEIWEESDDGEISPQKIKNTIKKVAGYTVVDKYWEELHNFDRIEQVPETQTWIVNKPEKAGIDTKKTGERKAKRVMIPEDVLKAGEQYGVNFSAVMTEALIDEISNKEQFIEDYLGDSYSENESDFIFSLLKNDLYQRKGDKRQIARRDKRRRSLFKDIFGKDKVSKEQEKQIEKLRKKSFKLNEMLEV